MQCSTTVLAVYVFIMKLPNHGEGGQRRRDRIALSLPRIQGASVSPESLQNLATKDLVTAAIQNSLLCAKELGQEEVNTFIEERIIVPEKGDKPDVPIHASLHRCNAKTFESLYEVVKDTKTKTRELSSRQTETSSNALLLPTRQVVQLTCHLF